MEKSVYPLKGAPPRAASVSEKRIFGSVHVIAYLPSSVQIQCHQRDKSAEHEASPSVIKVSIAISLSGLVADALTYQVYVESRRMVVYAHVFMNLYVDVMDRRIATLALQASRA